MKRFIKKLVWRLWPDYFIKKYFDNHSRPEIEEKIIKFFMSPQNISIDVGAHGAKFTSIMSLCSKRVLALEPIPHLADGIRRFSFPNVEVLTAAASDTNGKFKLYIPKDGDKQLLPLSTLERSTLDPALPFDEIEVKTLRLDDICTGTVDFIKVDVEGHEVSVLKGARSIIEKNGPVLLLEANSAEELAVILEYIETISYRMVYIYNGQLQNPALTFPSLPSSDDGKLLAYNYIFVPKDGSRDDSLEKVDAFLKD